MPSSQTSSFLADDLSTPVGRPLTFVFLGAGGRGTIYGNLAARRPGQATVVAVAEPRRTLLEAFAASHKVPPERRFLDWRELLERRRLADVAVIALPDAEHAEAAVALADLGYHILLEKPMATTEADCEAISEAARRNGTALAIAHVLRYTPYTTALKQLLRDGVIGDIVSVQHLEPIGYYHFAHSYVRGNWRREDESTFLLMAKSCHDIDWLTDIIGRRVRSVSSFGSLTHFTAEAAPEGAGDRCVSCAIEHTCPYSAKRTYVEGLRRGGPRGYFTRIATAGKLAEDAVADALAEGPYGRCVYSSDNDVVDHQVVNLEYEGGVTAAFTLTAFTHWNSGRRKSSVRVASSPGTAVTWKSSTS